MTRLFYPLIMVFLSCTQHAPETISGKIKAGGFDVYYERHGTGSPLLLLHAGLQDHTMWQGQADALARSYEVITIDLPYHGDTNGNDTTLLARDLLSILLDSLDIKQVSIAGLSMGASVAQDFVIAYPDKVTKAIFMAGGINGYEKKFPIDSFSMAWYHLFDTALKMKDTARAAREFTSAWAEGYYRKGDSLKAPVSLYVYATTLGTLHKHKLAGWPRLDNNPPAMERISSIQVPVLLLYGDKDLPYIISANEYMAKHIPGVQHVVLKDVAHMFNMEKADEVNKLINGFLMSR